MYRILKLENTVAGTLSGPRFGIVNSYALGIETWLRLSTSVGYSSGMNSSNSSTFSEKVTSWDIKPTLSLQVNRYALGIAARYEVFNVDVAMPGQAYSRTYRGLEFGPSFQVAFFRAQIFDLTLGAEYLVGNLDSLESSQLGLKLQVCFYF